MNAVIILGSVVLGYCTATAADYLRKKHGWAPFSLIEKILIMGGAGVLNVAIQQFGTWLKS